MKKFSRKILLFFLLTIVVCPGFTKMSYGEALVHVDFTKANPTVVGERIDVNIQIAGAQDVAGYELTVGFDPTALRYIEGANADYLPVGAFTLSPVVSNDTVYIAATSLFGPASVGEGTLAVLTFEVIAARDSTIELMNVILSNSVGIPLAVTTRDGRLMTIQLPSIGDVNEDGRVNILDLTLVASNFTVASLTTPRADVNKDGAVNILDLVMVTQHLDIVRGGGIATKIGVIPVNPEEVPISSVRPSIDFAAEKAAIQEVYSAFYKAFNDNDIKAIQETVNTSKIVFGTIFAGNEPVPLAIGWKNVQIGINGLWIGIGTKGAKWGQNDQLTDFWIDYKGSKLEAAAIGYNCYKGSFPGETHLYLMKDPKDGWRIHELDSSTENNLGIFGFHKGKPRIEEFIRVTREVKKVP